MSAPANDTAIPPLEKVLRKLRPLLARDTSIKDRLQTFWSYLVEARELGSSDVIADEFLEAAQGSGLTRHLGRHGAEDIDHVVRWGLRGWNPFERGTLHG
jgi:hypothetical protein